jgi:murein L,D-transpeptidase YcbB/YkuD
VRDLAGTPASKQIYYIDEGLRPREPCASVVLDEAAQAPSVDELLMRFREPNRVAATLRAELAAEPDPHRRALLSSDLALARSIGSPKRFVLVDTSSQRLWMIGGNGGTMKVVVGKSGMDTPPMAGLIRFAVVNPYWDIPPDLVRDEVAPRVAAGGSTYLAARNYEAVTSYEDSGVPLESSTIDWEAVRSGSAKIGIRQLPGPDNMMGRVMFMFPNKFGIYLHDTPVRWVFSKTDRRVSHGCVRLERADELYQWLFGRPLESDESTPPQTRESLSEPVPVYIVSLRAGSLGS